MRDYVGLTKVRGSAVRTGLFLWVRVKREVYFSVTCLDFYWTMFQTLSIF